MSVAPYRPFRPDFFVDDGFSAKGAGPVSSLFALPVLAVAAD